MKILSSSHLFSTSILLALCSFLLALPCGAGEWKRVSSKDGKISALFPVDIGENPQSQVDKTPAGKVTSYFGEYYGNGILLAGSGADIPRLARVAGENAMFGGSKKVFLAQAKGTEISFKEAEVEGAPARVLLYKGKAYQGKGAPYEGKAIFIVVNKRMYVINSVISKASDANRAAEKKLFDSIQIKK
jgi:hypothetical protein